jgi:hypothetical protein
MRRTELLNLLMMLPLSVHSVLGQTAQQEPAKVNPQVAAGRLVAKGDSNRLIGTDKLVTYKLEEVDLAAPIDLVFRGKSHHLSSVMRLTITSDSIGGAHAIWINDAALTGVFGLGRNAIGVLIYDRSVLADGAEMAVWNGRELVTLPERLRLPKEFTATIDPLVDEGNSIMAMQRGVRISDSVRERIVQIWMRTAREFPTRNAALELQIGKDFFMNELGTGLDGHSLTVIMTASRFEQLRAGADVVAFFIRPDRSGAFGKEIWYFGKLDKSMLDR